MHANSAVMMFLYAMAIERAIENGTKSHCNYCISTDATLTFGLHKWISRIHLNLMIPFSMECLVAKYAHIFKNMQKYEMLRLKYAGIFSPYFRTDRQNV